MEQSVPKRRHIKFSRRGITQKKAYDIQNTTKVLNHEHVVTLQKTTQPVPYMHHSAIPISHIAFIYFFMIVIFDQFVFY